MELSELLKMISSIPQRKSKCRGNLRLKVLLKTTYDYARRSWIDGQFGRPQKLQTLLKNSIFDHSSTLSSDDSLNSDTEATLSNEEQSIVKLNHQTEQLIDTSINEISDDILRSDLSLEDDINENENNHTLKLREETEENLPELQRVMKRLLRNCNMLIEINEHSCSSIPDYHLNLRKLKRIIHLSRIARIHLERDYENQDFGQQKINRKALKLIRYLLKQCKTLLKVNYNTALDHHKLKKIIRKLKKFENCAEKIIAYEKFCEDDLNRQVVPTHAFSKKEVFNQFFSFERDQIKNSNSNCHFNHIPGHKNSNQSPYVKSDMLSTNTQKSDNKPSPMKRSRSEMEDDSARRERLLQHEFFYRRFELASYYTLNR